MERCEFFEKFSSNRVCQRRATEARFPWGRTQGSGQQKHVFFHGFPAASTPNTCDEKHYLFIYKYMSSVDTPAFVSLKRPNL